VARAAALTVDAHGLDPLLRGIEQLERSLEDEANTRLQAAAGKAGAQLLSVLRQSAASSPTPQARIVAESLRLRRDRTVSLELGGSVGVGSRGTAAGAILWGSEHGGANFGASSGGSYWIGPAVDRYAASGADGPYLEAANGLLRDSGLL